MTKILIDPGHGGKDSGATGGGLKEKDLTLDIAKRVKKYLDDKYTGHTTRLTRTGDNYLSLTDRTTLANTWGADYLMSIHINAGGGTGFESFIFNGRVSDATVSHRSLIHDTIMKQFDVANRGKKKANFAVLRQSKMPAMLTENLFIDRKEDIKLLKEIAFRQAVAEGHAEGLVKAFKLKKKDKGTTFPTKGDTYFRVVAGSYKNKQNALDQATKLKKLGIKGVFLAAHKE